MDEFGCYIEDVFKFARIGELENLKLLVEDHNIELNIRDEWDSTPLYYACLCGHEEIVDFLLKNGARCEANTFDAERCFYAALTQRIKTMLRDYKTVTSEYMKRDLYLEFLRGCLDGCNFADITFKVDNESIAAHKVILSARCPYFATMLEGKWNDRNSVRLKNDTVSASAFRRFVQFLYFGRLDIPLKEVNDLIAICKKCQMESLVKRVENAVRSFHHYADTKPEHMRSKISMISISDGKEMDDVQKSFLKLAELCMPNPLRFKQFFDAVPEIFTIFLDEEYERTDWRLVSCDGFPCFADVCFDIHGQEFLCHKVFFCRRSDYFKALIHFSETDDSSSSDLLKIYLNDLTPEVFAAVVNFIYTNQCKIQPDTAFDLLYFSDLFLLSGLKNKCAAFLSQQLVQDNVILILKLARLYGLERLESHCAGFIAINLPELIYRSEFSDLVMADASMIKNREDTDTIQIIDDIRHHLLKLAFPGMNSSYLDVDVKSRFDLLDDALKNLGLDA